MTLARHHPVHRDSARYRSRPTAAPANAGERVLEWSCGILLVLVFITGGSSQQHGWGVMLAELMALGLMLFTLSQPTWRERITSARWPLAAACCIIAIPLLQLLPLPAWLWNLPAPRAALRHDLASAGVTHIAQRWSLAPAATERDLFLLLPGLALFVATLALPRDAWRHLLGWLIGLIVFSVILALAQLQAPQDSLLNPFPQYAPALAGVFANRNHQACAVVMGLVLALAMLLHHRMQARYAPVSHATTTGCVALIVLLAGILPPIGSRAGVILAIIGTATTLFAYGTWSPQHLHSRPAARWLFAGVVTVLAIGTYGAFAWMQQDADIAGSRWQIAGATTRLAAASMPLGGGAGSFVRMFEQFTRGALMHQGYINAAHNDYLQWWYAGGVLAIAVMILAAGVLLTALLRILKLPPESGLRHTGLAALLALLIPLLHSTVDYPLRTPALMSVFGLLAGIAVATGIRAKSRLTSEPDIPR